MKKYFGTDGIRGRVGDYPITADFMLKLGWAAGEVLAQGDGGRVLIGKDTRISGYMFESALQAGLSAAGVDIHLLGPMPTPAIAYLTRTLHMDAGIVISASHNPYYDNGIKFFSSAGTKLGDEIEHAIEECIERPMTTVDSRLLGKASRVVDAAGRYIEFCKNTVSPQINLKGMKIVVDCANGATYDVTPRVLEELGADVIPLCTSPDGLNINEQCGSTLPQALSEAVVHEQADLGIALDGDGDRVIMVDTFGHIVDGDELLFIIARSRKENGQLAGKVVGTQMSNLGLEHALKGLGIDFDRAKVGDRYVLEMLSRSDSVIGGEGSGHIICLDRTTTGDGTIAALQVLAAMRQSGKPLHELKSGMQKYPQILINVPVGQKVDLGSHAGIQAAVQEVESTLAGTGRVLLRPSGTEPLIRVMVEGQDAELVELLARRLADTVEMTLAV
jgi:phosphoglucosamine mutase